MGTTLTGTKPKDTYDSLIKVEDNGPISGTAKYLSDGLGNNLPIAVSTSNVGIGTSSPAEKLSVAGAIISTGAITGHGANRVSISQEGANGAFIQSYGANTSTVGAFTFRQASSDFSITQIPLAITTSGVLDISSGIKFPATQVASADANTLDDYEEGTFTPTVVGTTTAGTATYAGGQAGLYTKIGRMVYVSIYLSYSGGTGTGDLRIAGLPFAISSADVPSFTIGALSDIALTALNVPVAFGVGPSTQININQLPVGGGTQSAVPYDGAGVIVMSGFYQV